MDMIRRRSSHLESYDRDGNVFLHRIVAFDEICARLYEPQLKRQSNAWCRYASPRQTKVPHTPTNVKVMLHMAHPVAHLYPARL